MTMTQKALLAGLGVLSVGLAAGYGAGVVKERADADEWRGNMMRAEDGRGNFFGNDDAHGRGAGIENRKGRLGADSGQGGGQLGMRRDAGAPAGQGRGINKGNCLSDECLLVDGFDYPAGDLTDAAKSALLSALDDEYKAWSTYDAVMKKSGSARPFSMIIRAEEQHISSLRALFDKYGVAVPENPYVGKIAAPDTMIAACQAGVDAEIANASLYRDRLLPAVKEYADISLVFTNLMNASQERHLPAFDRCN